MLRGIYEYANHMYDTSWTYHTKFILVSQRSPMQHRQTLTFSQEGGRMAVVMSCAEAHAAKEKTWALLSTWLIVCFAP